MFTGIVTDIGEVVAVQDRDTLRRLTVACRYPAASIALGASICHCGICMTVVEIGEQDGRTVYAVDAAAETLRLTTAGTWQVGTRLNLERSLKIGDELGGHIVTGHVDGLAEVISRRDADAQATFVIRAPKALARFIAAKGSVALDGTSLTVNTVENDDFSVHIIPHTLAVTTWGAVKAGDRLNLEVDLMARYAARLAEAR
ncbi:riboflavin synthase [Blastochloris tepida]|uniref:Riboflavin synthase n=1 Tax=Blastochloris tepida TaxID=2233851 RepID=A0A348G1K5_9HYPH|nr:riboflavin synthase [Blastochloris tepida]BBF93438.1 riboflavin synthase subunit alpha [Blastochloris tepida]